MQFDLIGGILRLWLMFSCCAWAAQNSAEQQFLAIQFKILALGLCSFEHRNSGLLQNHETKEFQAFSRFSGLNGCSRIGIKQSCIINFRFANVKHTTTFTKSTLTCLVSRPRPKASLFTKCLLNLVYVLQHFVEAFMTQNICNEPYFLWGYYNTMHSISSTRLPIYLTVDMKFLDFVARYQLPKKNGL